MTASGSRTEPQESGAVEAAADAALAVPVWDLPIRLFHWTLVVLVGFSWWSAENGEIEWHIRSGLALLFLLLFRLLWGLVGSSTARFRSFVRGPAALWRYLRRPSEWRGIGHTPLGALSVVALLGVLLLQVSTGLALSDEDGIHAGPLNARVPFETAEAAHDLHLTSFDFLLVLMALHVAAILFYRLRGKRLVRAMVTGRSLDHAGSSEGLEPASGARLLLCLGLSAAVTAWISMGVPGL
jgi:cytochrome b